MRAHYLLGLGLTICSPLALTLACGESFTDEGGSDGNGNDGDGGTDGNASGGSGAGGNPSMMEGGAAGAMNMSPGGASNLGGAGGLSEMNEEFVGEEPCESDKECTSMGFLCDSDRRVCAECITNDDCGESGVCEFGSCTELTTCDNSLNCSTDQVCVEPPNSDSGVCQECGDDVDCLDGGTCVGGECRVSCESDNECTDAGMLCDPDAGLCTTCIEHDDCDSGDVCAPGGECVTGVCTPGVSQCLDNAIVTCRNDGLGYLEPQDCGGDVCRSGDGDAECVDGDGPGGPNNGDALLSEDFSDGTGLWNLSGAASGPPMIQGGQACVSDTSFTLGWPSEGDGLDLEPGDYTLSFDTSLMGEAVPGVWAKVAHSQDPFEPVYVEEGVGVDESTSHDVSFGVEAAGESVGIAFNVEGNEGTVCFDNIVLTEN